MYFTNELMLQADKVVDLVYTKYLKALVSYDGLQRVETYLTPKEAFREIVLNAINHKLYETGNPIQISVIISPLSVSRKSTIFSLLSG